MKNREKTQRILWCEGIGFGLIIALSWLNELFSLPEALFGGPRHPNWREAVMETIVTLAVGCSVFLFTRKLLARLYYLKSFLRICGWCKKIHYENGWVPLEEYFAKGFETRTSHGICPTCAEQVRSKSKANRAAG